MLLGLVLADLECCCCYYFVVLLNPISISFALQGHVSGDTVFSANIGYITGLLYNQNNVTQESSSVTTTYEIEVGKDLSEMLGFDRGKSRGHLTAGGTIANIEVMWAARNVKFLPLAFESAL